MPKGLPRILITAFRGGSGKSLVSLGVIASLRSRGRKVAVFKKGPDYIDAAWLSRAGGSPCFNLDTYLMGDQGVRSSFERRTRGADLAVVEGNRGLFDGVDVEGLHSSAALAKLIGLSVFIVADCTKSTRTLAALVKGCQSLDPGVSIRGIVLNQVANARQESIIKGSIEKYCALPVVGSLPRIPALRFPERHLGLFPPQEHGDAEATIRLIQEAVERYLDLERLLFLAGQDAAEASHPQGTQIARGQGIPSQSCERPSCGLRVGIFRDQAFHFYYPENLEMLREGGAEIIELDASREGALPHLDALYIGGGFPETQAEALAGNRDFMHSVREAVEAGLPVYAECGGAVYLGKGLKWKGRFYPFAGVFPVTYELHEKPQGHGYTLLDVEDENPFFPRGVRLKGHEFHYSGVLRWEEQDLRFACKVRKGYGFDGSREGLCYRNAYATFSHLHALGEPDWANRFLKRAAMEAAAG
ncbi:MAG: cobyrinate a,c-diamide synthase [bacterium]